MGGLYLESPSVEQYLAGLRGLLEQYTLPTAGNVQVQNFDYNRSN